MQQRALITGATGGIGRAIAEALAPTHALILVGRRQEALDELVAKLPAATALCVDLTQEDGLGKVAAAATELDVLVHSAGVLHLGDVAELSAEAWRESMELNVVVPARVTQAVLPQLRERRGHVFFLNSGLGHRTMAGGSAYSASKFALRALADTLREEEAQAGVRVTSIHPGRVATPMQQRLRAWEQQPYDGDAWIRPEQVAAAVSGVLHVGPGATIPTLDISPESIGRSTR